MLDGRMEWSFARRLDGETVVASCSGTTISPEICLNGSERGARPLLDQLARAWIYAPTFVAFDVWNHFSSRRAIRSRPAAVNETPNRLTTLAALRLWRAFDGRGSAKPECRPCG